MAFKRPPLGGRGRERKRPFKPRYPDWITQRFNCVQPDPLPPPTPQLWLHGYAGVNSHLARPPLSLPLLPLITRSSSLVGKKSFFTGPIRRWCWIYRSIGFDDYPSRFIDLHALFEDDNRDRVWRIYNFSTVWKELSTRFYILNISCVFLYVENENLLNIDDPNNHLSLSLFSFFFVFHY